MMTDVIPVSLHIVLPSFVVAVWETALNFLLWDLILSSVHRVMRPQMTVEVLLFCATVVGTAFYSFGTFTWSAVVVLMLPVRKIASARKNRTSGRDEQEGEAGVLEEEEARTLDRISA